MSPTLIILPLLSILTAAVTAVIRSGDPGNAYVATIGWGISLGFLISWILLERDALLQMLKRRGAKYGASSGLSVCLAVLLVVGLCFLSSRPRFNKTWDVTRSGVNTLSDQSEKLIEKLKSEQIPVVIEAFFQSEAQEDKFRNLLARYEAKGFLFTKTFTNPIDDPVKALSAELTNGDTVILKLGDKESRVTDFTEEQFTNALIRVMKPQNKSIAFLSGHGEGSLDSEDAEGLSLATSSLRNNNYQLRSLNLLESGEIPDDIDLVIAAGPRYDFREEELRMLAAYLEKGGSMFLLVDAIVDVPKLNSFLDKYGLAFDNDLILLHPDDPRAALHGQNNAIVSNFDSFHKITRTMASQSSLSLLLMNARSVKRVKDGEEDDQNYTELAKTSDSLVALGGVRTRDDLKTPTRDRVKTGPFTVMSILSGQPSGKTVASNSDSASTAMEADPRPFQLVLSGSAQISNNAGAARGENLDTFINTVNYLLEDEDYISLRPKDQEKTSLDMTSVNSQLSLLMLSYIYPFLFLGGNLVVWSRRRRS